MANHTGNGGWPKGRTRSTLTASERARCIRKLRKLRETESLRAIARTIGVTDKTLRRILAGERQPSAYTLERLSARY